MANDTSTTAQTESSQAVITASTEHSEAITTSTDHSKATTASTGKKEKKDMENKSKATKSNKKKERKIPMPKRSVKIKGCSSINKRIKKLKKQKALLKNKIQKESKKQKALDTFYSDLDKTYGTQVALLGKKIETETKLSKKDQDFQKKLIALSEVFNDAELKNIAENYVFGLRTDYNFSSILKDDKLFDLNIYLQQKQIKSTVSMQNQIKEIDKKIAKEKKTRFFDPKDVSSISNITVDDAKKMLSGTALYPEAVAFVKAERIHHVNAVFLMGIAAHESAWGTSRRAKEDNNLTGYGVYSDSAKGINKKSKEEGLLATAETLHERYLTKGGSYYKGTSVADVNYHYCVGDEWAGAVTKYAYQLMERL